MDLDPTDEQRSIIDVFGALADRTCPVDRLREHEPLGFSPELWAQLVAVGAPGMAVPEDAGGAGADLLDLSLAVEALGRRLAPSPLVEHAVTARLLARADALPDDVLDGAQLATLALRPARRPHGPAGTGGRGRRSGRGARRRRPRGGRVTPG